MGRLNEILVTGGAGYIGSHTVVELISRGYEPIIVDDFRNSDESVLKGIQAISQTQPKVYRVDVTNKAALEEVFKNHSFAGIIHFAADKAVGESVELPLKYYSNNLIGLINCLQLAQSYEVDNFVFSSSCTVYGEPKGIKVVDEESPIQEANSPYGATKQMCERILTDVHASSDSIKILSLRYFNPIGAHSSSHIGELPLGTPNNLVPYITQTAAGVLEELTVFGNDYNTEDGTCIRDYIHVMDLADAHIKGFEFLEKTSDAQLEVVNIGTGYGASVLEIIHTFEEVSGNNLKWKFGPKRSGDVESIYADVSKAEKLLGWTATRNIKDAINDAWNWEKRLRSAK